jgi:hypothetical protein
MPGVRGEANGGCRLTRCCSVAADAGDPPATNAETETDTLNAITKTLYNLHYQELISRVRRGVVRLMYVHTRRGPERGADVVDPVLQVNTAFMIEGRIGRRGAVWFVVTAGHVLQDFCDRAVGERRLFSIYLASGLDGLPDNPPRYTEVPLSQMAVKHVVDEDKGLDIGVMMLGPDLQEQMRATPVEPFPPGVWAAGVVQHPQTFITAGFLGDSRSPARISRGKDGLQIVGGSETLIDVPLEPIADHQYERGGPRTQRFCGRITQRYGTIGGTPEPLTNTRGLSGGPIVAVQIENNGCRYAVRAVQTHEVVEEGVVIGNFMVQVWNDVVKPKPWLTLGPAPWIRDMRGLDEPAGETPQ